MPAFDRDPVSGKATALADAAGVRRHAGKQAEVLNKILADTFHGSPLSNTKLKEVLGHSPLQVICGAMLGVLITLYFRNLA